MMKFLHKVILGALLATTATTALPSLAQANAHSSNPHTRYYRVYYRTCVQSPWVLYYTFNCPVEAQRYANWIRASYGYEVFVR